MKFNLKKLKTIPHGRSIEAWIQGFEAQLREMLVNPDVPIVTTEMFIKEILGE